MASTSVTETLNKFYGFTGGGEKLIVDAAGVLVFPEIIKAGLFGFGGQYGAGALVVNKEIDSYYELISASFGFQLGIQSYSTIIVFLTENALKEFKYSEGWKIGVDASVAVITLGAGAKLDTENIKDSVIAFVFDNKGLMYSLSLEGTKISRLPDPKK